ncbi:uncharacterized protein C8Q71DRAFT_509130 [Rhodofomes roseus]|uniref:Uncharacterized protein n=1 Tax=Rhodofomes roseus TaxID=34475 RepID=A0ABQ8KMN5_9APHY|nr:uncharacterized protein C8Q71DRAFT_509130 [Rhodofomes roseus]KAH9839379.1 hypothetical protein C8Q71DRAFT_509130 [Rhodofomes roseus]
MLSYTAFVSWTIQGMLVDAASSGNLPPLVTPEELKLPGRTGFPPQVNSACVLNAACSLNVGCGYQWIDRMCFVWRYVRWMKERVGYTSFHSMYAHVATPMSLQKVLNYTLRMRRTVFPLRCRPISFVLR